MSDEALFEIAGLREGGGHLKNVVSCSKRFRVGQLHNGIGHHVWRSAFVRIIKMIALLNNMDIS